MNYFKIYDINDTLLYSCYTYLPTIDPPDVDRESKYSKFEGVDGSILVYGRTKPGKFDHRFKTNFTFTFEYIDQLGVNIFKLLEANKQTVKLQYDLRWRQLKCIVTGERQLTIYGGEYYNNDGCFWLLNDYNLTVNDNDTKVYITTDLSTGLITVDSGTSIPENGVEIAEISAPTGQILSITSPTTGVPNMRKAKILNVKTISRPITRKGLEVTLVEVD